MAQNFHGFQYEGSEGSKYTAFGGLPLFSEMVKGCGLLDEIKDKLQLNKQGWLDSQILQAILQLNFSGGDCLEDIDLLEADEGLKELLHQTECQPQVRLITARRAPAWPTNRVPGREWRMPPVG